jgi:hypothetical protein
LSKVIITEILESESIIAWKESPHGTTFTNPFVLKNLAYKVRWFAAKKGDETLCFWPICINDNNQVYLPDFSYYVGPFWTKIGWNIPNHRLLSRRLEVYESFLNKFENEFGSFTCSLPIGLTDVRAFDWWNYHNEKKPRVKIFPKFTAQISYPESSFKIEKLYREVRRQELKKIEKLDNFYICEDTEPKLIYDLYFSILTKQNLKISESTKNSIKQLYKLTNSEYGFLNVIKDKTNDELAYVALILRAKGISNLVLSLTNDIYRKTGMSVYGIHSTIKKSLNFGDLIFDFNGANSPKRSDDKHSYGAEEKLYFDLSYNM